MDSLVSAFQKMIEHSPSSSDWRKKAFQSFQESGLPTRKLESWKYTSLKAFSEKVFTPLLWNEKKISSSALDIQLQSQIVAAKNSDFEQLFFVNGEFVFDQSTKLDRLESQGLKVETLSDEPPVSSLNQLPDSMVSLQRAFSGFRLSLTLKKGVALAKPLQILHLVQVTNGPAVMMQPQIRLHLGPGSSLSFLQTWLGSEASTYFVQPLVEVQLEEGSNLKLVDQQNLGRRAYFISHTFVTLNQGSNLMALSYQTGSLLSRNQLQVKIQGHHSSSQFLGLNVLGLNQHCDQNTRIQFIDGQSTSEQLYKSILSGEARSVFSGLIKINPQAQKSYSNQLNKNLLLSDKAQCDSEPQLEIEADDVKANHGSTVGQLSEDEIFYLRSRGLSKQKSVEMLSYGFAADMIERFEEKSLKSYLSKALSEDFKKLSTDLPKAKSL